MGIQASRKVSVDHDEDSAVPTPWAELVAHDSHLRQVLKRHNSVTEHSLAIRRLARHPAGKEVVLHHDIVAAQRHEKEGLKGSKRDDATRARRLARKRAHGLGNLKQLVAERVASAQQQDPRLTRALLREKLDLDRVVEQLQQGGMDEEPEALWRSLDSERKLLRRTLAQERWKAAILEIMSDTRACLTIESFFMSGNTGEFSLRNLYYLVHDPTYSSLYSSHKPYFIVLCVITQILFYAASCHTEGGVSRCYPDAMVWRQVDLECTRRCVGGEYRYTLTTTDIRHEGWRFVSYGLLHADFGHLIGNAIMELLLGVPLEMVHGWHVPLLFLLSILGGSVTNVWSNPWKGVVGSSGGLYGLFGVHYANLFLNWKEISHEWLKWARLVFLLIMTIIMGYDLYNAGSREDNISHGAHVGGLITGFFFGLPLLRDIKLELMERRKDESKKTKGLHEVQEEHWAERAFILGEPLSESFTP
eukprot:scaffold1584_cov259-Pinguiococcus_pyrenoidosus.AAC.4